MTLELTITDLANGGVPFAGVAVYVWHCDREGRYSMYSQGINDQNYLRGVQVADAAGMVTFTSIFPACYCGRWPHIHFEVYPDQAASPTPATPSPRRRSRSPGRLRGSLCAARLRGLGQEPAQVSLHSDNVFGDDGGAQPARDGHRRRHHGYSVSLAVGVDTGTTPTGGGAPGGGPPGRRRLDAARGAWPDGAIGSRFGRSRAAVCHGASPVPVWGMNFLASVSFDVTADCIYPRFMGRLLRTAAAPHSWRLLNLREGERALDVGCGPGP